MKEPIRIAMIDDNTILREALPKVLENQENMTVVHSSPDIFQAIEIAKDSKADVLILEPMVPGKDGIDVIKDIVALNRGVHILVFTADNTPSRAFRILRAGAMGWLSKRASTTTLIQAIMTVQAGRVYLPQSLQTIFAERYVHPASVGNPEDQLSDREYQVMTLLAQGLSNREIASSLFIGVKTVDTHRGNLIRKLGLRNNADITRFAIRHGLIEA